MSPLYRVIQDHLESALRAEVHSPEPGENIGEDPASPETVTGHAEEAMRGYMECGVPRFGMVRYLCRKCGRDILVATSCKRRGACPSCDGKRGAVTTGRAMEELLPRAPYRQWVLVIPKRLRYHVNRNARLAGEINRILRKTLSDYYRRVCGQGAEASPAQIDVLQRFGSSVNLHVHIHSVVSDGVFSPEGETGVRFYPAVPISAQDMENLSESIRRKVLRRFRKLGVMDAETEQSMRVWEHSGFNLNGDVRVDGEDRAGLERILGYCLRGAIKLEKMGYDGTRVKYRVEKPGQRGVTLEWGGEEFVRRWSRLIPPPRQHIVKYGGVLGPRSGMRERVTAAAHEGRSYEDLLAGRSPSEIGILARKAVREAGTRVKMYFGTWAACLKRVFEVSPILCEACGVEMVPVAAITEDRELERLLNHLGLPTEWPKMKPARSPPVAVGADSQVNPEAERWDGIDSLSPEE